MTRTNPSPISDTFGHFWTFLDTSTQSWTEPVIFGRLRSLFWKPQKAVLISAVVVRTNEKIAILNFKIMARIQKGILGGFSGTVGTVVGANWRGVDIIRSRPKKSSRVPTDAQSEQRARFALVAHFLRPIRVILRLYFGQAAADKSKSNQATSYHITEAIAGIFPNFVIDYAKVIISKGELLGLQDTSVTPQSGAELKINWVDNSGQGQAVALDLMSAAVYSETRGEWVYRLTAAQRADGTFTYTLPLPWVGDSVHCWVAVATADNRKYSNSEYFGPLVLV